MSIQQYLRFISMDRAAKTCIRTTLKLANSAMAIAGIALLMYSVWMVVVCLRDYHKYQFPWFLWACIGMGITLCLTACVGHAAARSRNTCLLSLYILVVFLLLLAEILVTADVFLNDDWDKDFPKDYTKRFDDFVHFLDDNDEIFSLLGFLMIIAQVTSFLLAMILRAIRHSRQPLLDDYHNNQTFVNVPVGPPYVVGPPYFVPQNNVLDEALLGKDQSNPYFDQKGTKPMGGAVGYPLINP